MLHLLGAPSTIERGAGNEGEDMSITATRAPVAPVVPAPAATPADDGTPTWLNPVRDGDPSSAVLGALTGGIVGIGAGFGLHKLAAARFARLGHPARVGAVLLGAAATAGAIYGGISVASALTRPHAKESERIRGAAARDADIERRTYRALADGHLARADVPVVDRLRLERTELASSDRRNDTRHLVSSLVGGSAAAAVSVLGLYAMRSKPPAFGERLAVEILTPGVALLAFGAGAGIGRVGSMTLLRGDVRDAPNASQQARLQQIDAELDRLLGPS
jgi:hypothetical protein